MSKNTSSISLLRFAPIVLGLLGCFNEQTIPFTDADILRVKASGPAIDAYVRDLRTDELVIVSPPQIAAQLLDALLPIKTSRETASQLRADFEFGYQVARNPLIVSIVLSEHDAGLTFQIDNFVYTGGSADSFRKCLARIRSSE